MIVQRRSVLALMLQKMLFDMPTELLPYISRDGMTYYIHPATHPHDGATVLATWRTGKRDRVFQMVGHYTRTGDLVTIRGSDRVVTRPIGDIEIVGIAVSTGA